MNLNLQPGLPRHPDARVPAGRALRVALSVATLVAALPAFAITPTANGVGSVTNAPRQGAAAASAVSRDGVVQAFDAAGQTIEINAAHYKIGPPVLALLDKRPKSNGLLKFTDLKVGMVVRYRVENERVVELWVMRDPQTGGAR